MGETLRNGTSDENGTVVEQVGYVADHVEVLAQQVREVDDETTFHLMSEAVGVSEPLTFGDILDVISMGLRKIESEHSSSQQP